MITDFKPLNPWGRPMPRPKGRVGDAKNPKLEQLFQVFVDTEKRKDIPVGPKWSKEFAERLLMAINAKIIEGKERRWMNPRLVAIKSNLT